MRVRFSSPLSLSLFLSFFFSSSPLPLSLSPSVAPSFSTLSRSCTPSCDSPRDHARARDLGDGTGENVFAVQRPACTKGMEERSPSVKIAFLEFRFFHAFRSHSPSPFFFPSFLFQESVSLLSLSSSPCKRAPFNRTTTDAILTNRRGIQL